MSNFTSEQIIEGLMKYADTEIIYKLPTTGKWVVGTAIVLASNKLPAVVEYIKSIPAAQMLGIVDEAGNIDADQILEALRKTADRYGSMTVTFPLVGSMTFSSDDVERLKTYIS